MEKSAKRFRTGETKRVMAPRHHPLSTRTYLTRYGVQLLTVSRA